jgi:hypothetical protein
MNNIDLEFYYHSQNPAHIQILHLLERVAREANCSGLSIPIALRLINCDDPSEIVPSHIPAVPCLRRVFPKPERLILAPLATFADIASAIGLPAHIHKLNTFGLDIFQGHPGQSQPNPTSTNH